MPEVRTALNHAYSHKDTDNNESYFECEYTGIVSKFNNKNETLGTYKDAFILTLDHKDSGSKELVVSLNIINKMKGDIPSDKFKKIVITLGEHFKKERDINIENTLKQIFEEP
ncbi:MAG: hypothetical protein O8C63_12130 [Candidatus Methanoperedens sp.]|nr:hypothetical protein [Candidatus Methanoperedens sp.]